MEYRAGSWSLDEEINLLEAMLICGLDWPSISKRCAGRTADECERHYYNYFIDNPRLIELSNLLTKTREASSNYKKFLCPSLVSDNTVCGCVDNECDNKFSSISNIKGENSTTNLDAFERTCESSDVSVKNEIFETNFDECKERKGTDSSKFVPKDINCSVSVSKTFEHKESLPENFNLKGIKQEVESDFTSEVKNCSSTIDGSNHFLSESSAHNIKLESDILSEVCSSETVKRNALEASNEEPSDIFQETTTENAELQRMRAGFDANRTEFDIEFDNGAEEVLNLLSHEIIQDDEDEDKRLVTELSLSVVEGYRHRLRERHRRKALVQRFGLLDYSKISNYMKTVESTFGKRFAKRLVLFKRLFTTKEYDNFMKGYQHLNQLKNHLNTLCNYRERGITTLAAGNLYEEMSKMRNESNKQIQSIPVVKRLENGESVLGHVFRRPAPPIAIHEMPGYECLEPEEVDFCSIQRIAPKSFLEYKNTLINECRKRKCLKLAHARPLLKIDVNKTRKLYDLLLNKNLIWKDEKMTDQ